MFQVPNKVIIIPAEGRRHISALRTPKVGSSEIWMNDLVAKMAR